MQEYTTSKKLSIRVIKRLCTQYEIKDALLSSTRDIEWKVLQKAKEYISIKILDHNTSIPIENLYQTPETLGKDRLAGVIGAAALYPAQTLMVVDIGTCITYDIIDEYKKYHGGNISPGVHLRLKAMHRYTDKLPLVDYLVNDDEIGKTTVKAMQNGAVYGTIGEIDSFIRRIKQKFGRLTVIFTGGDADKFANMLETKIFVLPYLILQGLNEIILHNNAA
jgi:type III pantothenate kinase